MVVVAAVVAVHGSRKIKIRQTENFHCSFRVRWRDGRVESNTASASQLSPRLLFVQQVGALCNVLTLFAVECLALVNFGGNLLG